MRLPACLAAVTTLTWLALPARAADPAAEAALKAKGLRRSGTTYVLPAEAEVARRINAARVLYRTASAASAMKQEFDRSVAESQARIGQMEQQYGLLNQQLAQNPPADPAEHNRLVGQINLLSVQINTLRRQASDDNRQAVGARLASSREDFLQAVIDLRQLVDKTEAEYRALADDPEVKSALDTLNRGEPGKARSKGKVVLGPSRSFQENVKLLAKVEASVLTEDVPLKKEGGVYWVDATFNGKVTRSMVFDTGASSVVLPSDLADELGLKPGPDTPKVTAQVADGSKVTAHKMVVPTVRVGKFTVADVECIVMPPEKKDVPPLLGQTFHRNFSIKLNADAGQLNLTRLDAGEPAPGGAAPKAKAATRPARPRRP